MASILFIKSSREEPGDKTEAEQNSNSFEGSCKSNTTKLNELFDHYIPWCLFSLNVQAMLPTSQSIFPSLSQYKSQCDM